MEHLWQDSAKKLEENVADFGRISETLLTKYGKVLRSAIYLHYKIYFYLKYFLVLTDFFRTLFKKSNCCRAVLPNRKNLEGALKEMYFFFSLLI